MCYYCVAFYWGAAPGGWVCGVAFWGRLGSNGGAGLNGVGSIFCFFGWFVVGGG